MTYPLSVTWVHREKTGVDSYNDDVYAEVTTPDVSAIFAPGSSTERTEGGDTVATQPTLYAVDPSLDIKANDAFIVSGYGNFEVDGDPAKYPPNPFDGIQDGQVIPLRKVTGG